MFAPKTERIKDIAKMYLERILELEKIFNKKTNVYIDYANIKPWSTKLGWHIDLKRLKQFLRSFDDINSIKFYHGTIIGEAVSEEFRDNMKRLFGEDAKTKPVKIMKLSIDISSIPIESPALLSDGKKVAIFGTTRRIASELNELREKGLTIFDIQKIRNFICWKKEMQNQ